MVLFPLASRLTDRLTIGSFRWRRTGITSIPLTPFFVLFVLNSVLNCCACGFNCRARVNLQSTRNRRNLFFESWTRIQKNGLQSNLVLIFYSTLHSLPNDYTFPLCPPPARCLCKMFILTSSYLIDSSICYLTITDKSYPRKLAFSYLQELAKEFSTSYGAEALKPNLRPYAFVQFDTFISATKRVYQDSRAQSNLDRLNVELQDVTRVMTKNIEYLIYRGDSLDRKTHSVFTLCLPVLCFFLSLLTDFRGYNVFPAFPLLFWHTLVWG